MKKRRGFRKFLHIYLIAIAAVIAVIAVCAYGSQLTSTGTIDFDNIPENVILMSPNGVAPSTGMSTIGLEPIVVHHEASGHYETVHHDAVTHEEPIYESHKVKDAWDEVVYQCTECGATKQK